MNTRVPYHNYIVVIPNGDVLGFEKRMMQENMWQDIM